MKRTNAVKKYVSNPTRTDNRNNQRVNYPVKDLKDVKDLKALNYNESSKRYVNNMIQHDNRLKKYFKKSIAL